MVVWLAVPDPEIEISRGGGGGGFWGPGEKVGGGGWPCRPCDKGGGLFGPQFGLKIRGSSPSRSPPPGSATA